MTAFSLPSRSRRAAALAVALTAASVASGVAAQGAEAEESAGWEPLTLTLEHRGEAAGTRCQIHLAHWFEVAFGPAQAGRAVPLSLLVRPQSGEVALLNTVGDRMRLERVDCGSTETPRADWARLPIDVLRQGGGAVTLRCDSSVAQSHCSWLR